MNIEQTLIEHRKVLDAIKILTQIKDPIVEKKTKRKRPVSPKGGRSAKYPWLFIELDECFLVPCGPTPAERQRVMNSLTSCIANARSRHGRKFCQRSETRGIRVWRTA